MNFAEILEIKSKLKAELAVFLQENNSVTHSYKFVLE